LREEHHLEGIALTGYGMEEDVQRSFEAGFATHLTKPVKIESLDQALDAILHRP
jgi:CheY-like chemotaxis protein